ncbi:hypothetical protein [Paenibacillus kyungheensis]
MSKPTMRTVTTTMSPEYEIRHIQFMYQTRQLFAIKKYVDMSPDDFDFDLHSEDLFLYKGILSCDARTGEVSTYYFPQSKVATLSNSANTHTLFYLAYSDDYNRLYCYKRDLEAEVDQLVFTKDIRGAYEPSINRIWSVHHFYSLNKRYALISYLLPDQERGFHYALIDAVEQNITPFVPGDTIRNIESIMGFNCNGIEYLLIKTGEHMVHERKIDWEYNRPEVEQLIVIAVDEFIAKVQANDTDLSDHIIFSSQSHEAFADLIILDHQLVILVERFDTADSLVMIYTVDNQNKEYISYPHVYNKLYHLNHIFYATHTSDMSTRLYKLSTGEQIAEILQPQGIVTMIEEGIVTIDQRLGSEDRQLYIYNDQGYTLWTEDCAWIDYKQQFIFKIKQSEQHSSL